MARRRETLLSVALATLSACQADARFVRVVADAEHGAVEAAWIVFVPPPGRPQVRLLSMVHVGEPAYYTAVQGELDTADVVLMEGLVREEEAGDGGSKAPDRVPGPRDRADEPGVASAPARIGGSLFPLAEAFSLVHQVDVLAWRDHFVKADMSVVRYRMLRVENPAATGASLRGLQRDVNFEIFRFRRRHPEVDGATAAAMVRRGVARRHLASAIERMAARGGPQPALNRQRSAIALRALDECAAGARVVLCWGYAHGSLLVRGLEQRGYARAAPDWRPVFAW